MSALRVFEYSRVKVAKTTSWIKSLNVAPTTKLDKKRYWICL